MKLSELMQELEYMQERAGEDNDPEVRFAGQPNWPFEYSVASVIMVDPTAPDTDEDEETMMDYHQSPDSNVVYLVEGSQLGYLPGNVKDECGW